MGENAGMDRQVQTYQTQQIMTSDPVTLVSLLYDKAVLCLKTAVLAIHKNEIEERWRNNSKAAEIIGHLLMTLDLEKGGEIAANLEALYRYRIGRSSCAMRRVSGEQIRFPPIGCWRATDEC